MNEDEIEEIHSKEHFYADFTPIQKIIKYIVYFYPQEPLSLENQNLNFDVEECLILQNIRFSLYVVRKKIWHLWPRVRIPVQVFFLSSEYLIESSEKL